MIGARKNSSGGPGDITVSLNMRSALRVLILICSCIPISLVTLVSLGSWFVPQTVFSCRGSYGVGKGALKCAALRRRCVRAVLLVNDNESQTDLQKKFVKFTF